jgi:hypothetical protein
MPKRALARRRRTTGDLLAELRAQRSGHRPCTAIVIPGAEPDTVALLIMGCDVSAGCATCDAARARLQPWQSPTPAALPLDDDTERAWDE